MQLKIITIVYVNDECKTLDTKSEINKIKDDHGSNLYLRTDNHSLFPFNVHNLETCIKVHTSIYRIDFADVETHTHKHFENHIILKYLGGAYNICQSVIDIIGYYLNDSNIIISCHDHIFIITALHNIADVLESSNIIKTYKVNRFINKFRNYGNLDRIINMMNYDELDDEFDVIP